MRNKRRKPKLSKQDSQEVRTFRAFLSAWKEAPNTPEGRKLLPKKWFDYAHGKNSKEESS